MVICLGFCLSVVIEGNVIKCAVENIWSEYVIIGKRFRTSKMFDIC